LRIELKNFDSPLSDIGFIEWGEYVDFFNTDLPKIVVKLVEGRISLKREVFRVENPEHLTMEEISKKFWDNFVLVTNTTSNAKSGIVRYYCYSNEPELTDLIMEMDKDEETYGDCVIRYVGQGRGFLGVYV